MKFQPFKPADYFHERQNSEQPRVGLCAPEKPIDVINESMARVKIIRMKTPRSRRQATINTYSQHLQKSPLLRSSVIPKSIERKAVTLRDRLQIKAFKIHGDKDLLKNSPRVGVVEV